jgi:hypothetical protein
MQPAFSLDTATASSRSPEGVGHPPHRARTECRPFFLQGFGLVALIALQTRWIAGYSSQMDIHIADELMYLWMMRDALVDGGAVNLSLCPLYSTAYFALDSVSWPVHTPDVMFMTMAVALPVALWWALFPLCGNTIAWLAACWFGASPVLVPAHASGLMSGPAVYAFTATLGVLGLGLVARNKAWWGLMFLSLAALTRAEYSPWIATSALVIAVSSRGFSTHMHRAAFAGLGMIPLFLGALHVDFKDKSWLAFRQHYGQQAQIEAHRLEYEAIQGVMPPGRIEEAAQERFTSFDYPDKWIERDFPGADSAWSAARVNPDRFIWHVSRVAREMPTGVGYMMSPWFAPQAAFSGWMLVLLCVAVIGWIRSAVGSPCRLPFPNKEVVALMVLSPLALVGSLMVGPRPELALPLAPGLLVLLGGGLRRWFKASASDEWQSLQRQAIAVFAVIGVIIATVSSGPFERPAVPLPYRDGVVLLKETLPVGARRVLTTFTPMLVRLTGRGDVQFVPPDIGPGGSLKAHLDQNRVDAIHVNPALLFQLRNVPDAFQAVQAGGWRLAGQRGSSMLYVREPL